MSLATTLGSPTEPSLSQTLTNNHPQSLPICQVCSNQIEDQNLNCDKCQAYFHLRCISATSASPGATIRCKICNEILNAKPAPYPDSQHEAVSVAHSVASSASRLDKITLEIKRLEEERAIQMEFVKKKYQILEKETCRSSASSAKNESVREWLDSQPRHIEPNQNPNSIQLSFPDEIHQLTQMQCDPIPNPGKENSALTFQPVPNTTGVVPTLLNMQPINSTMHALVDKSALMNTSAAKMPLVSSLMYAQPINSTINTHLHASSVQPTYSVNAPILAQTVPTRSHLQIPDGVAHNLNQPQAHANHDQQNTEQTNSSLFNTSAQIFSRSNLATDQVHARQSVPKELPIFSGMPEEWPLFKSTFDWSTNVCGLTEAENLIRIQRALRGEALRAVQHILIHPSCVPAVMATLKMLFGQPEKILHSIKNRIKNTSPINQNKLETFTAFAVNIKGLQATIEACGLQDELNNSSLLQDLVTKLPPYYQIIWGTHKLNLTKMNLKPNLQEFANWFFEVGLSASSVTVSDNVATVTEREVKNNRHKKAFFNTHNDTTNNNKNKCYACKGVCNNVANCKQFQVSPRDEKWTIIRKYNLCKQCLRQHSGLCKASKPCGVDNCQFKHHPLLHRSAHSTLQLKTADEQTNIQNCNAHNVASENILFKIIPIVVHGNFGKSVKTFAFIDEGSSVSLMDEALAEELALEGQASPLCLKWTSKIERFENNSRHIDIRISSKDQRVNVSVHTVRQLSLPIQSLDYDQLCRKYKHLKNLPIESYNNAVPQVLLGVNNWQLGIPVAFKEGGPNEPVAVRTRLGWIVYGVTTAVSSTGAFGNYHICECSKETCSKVQEIIKIHNSIDNIGVVPAKTNLVGAETERALTILNRYTKQRSDQHYETSLLWRFDNLNLPDSYQMSKNRLLCLERKLYADPQLMAVFTATINKYLDKSYIRKLTAAELEQSPGHRIWYLPIFAVFNKNKPGKVRVVWDAAAKASGVSLNSFLLKGPDFLASLPAILFRFRQKAVAVCGDIQDMFHQVYIRKEDQGVQRFLWRSDRHAEPDVYVMNVLPFGLSCAPCISQFVKNLNASKFEAKFPRAASAILKNHYVDDYLDSVDTVDEAVNLASEVKFIHQEGGFNIRNWCSNSPEVLRHLQASTGNEVKSLNISGELELEKVLGVFWRPFDDFITFQMSPAVAENQIFHGKKAPTKREMLRILMSVYDPLGLIGNFLMNLKILLQEVWRINVGWDETITPTLIDKWNQWVRILPTLINMKIPRCYLQSFESYEKLDVELHTFVDASDCGYAAVCYFRISSGTKIVCSLIGSKVRVAPLKILSVPRLELMAALIGARFANDIIKNHTLNITKKFFWSDSKTVLCWLRSDHRKYHQFVAFRVSEILDISGLSEWNWVPGKLNVADEATKWANRPNLDADSRWLNGPDFLYRHHSEWPQDMNSLQQSSEELKHFVCAQIKNDPIIDIRRFSNWNRLLRAVAYILRFIANLKSKIQNRPLRLSELEQNEIHTAEQLLYGLAQKEAFYEEISNLKSKIFIKKSSALYKLSAYLDSNDILRVDGRIDRATVSWDQKRPIILPKENYITQLILNHYHRKYHHMNHETVINELRQKFHIPRLRSIFKANVKHCQMCKINKVMPQTPEMAKLPRGRLSTYVSPFSFTGVDFFGPMIVTINRHKEKRYGALFTCLTIRAVHVEVVNSLNTSSCIMAIRNFMARRGTPIQFFSDNGTNFVGAERELREAIAEVDTNEFVRNFTTATTKWTFNPPAAPHMGGAWERLVRSIKVVLYSIMPTRFPSDELLRSMMAEVENIVNSRPLTYVPLDNESHEALTPNHLLLGSSNGMKPLSTCNDSAVVLKQSWLSSQQFAQNFWRRWVAEYLPTLTCRSKWFEKVKPLSEGDLVIVVDPGSPRNVWPRGKVISTKLASDGQVRSAKVLTSSGVLERPASKLAVLDVTPQKE